MAITLTQDEIDRLISEPKKLPSDYRKRMTTRGKRGHRERELAIEGTEESEFLVILRESMHNPLAFSVILGYRVPNTNQLFRLRRYNGKSYEHTNKLEGDTFYDFHVHQATERYQNSGFREDAYAKPVVTYSDFEGAVQCLIDECGFQRPDDDNMPLFEGQ
ncbi:MAG: hypothetical protein IH889_07825 [Planctomycetes bacterium]|nr:hypothetical protein [Planctomycetota bacterium]